MKNPAISQQYITASSGFILPNNNLYTPFKLENTATDSIFNMHIKSVHNELTKKFYEEANVCRSETINKILKDYVNNRSFENYIAMVDTTIDIFKNIDFSSFFKLQAANNNLSPLSYKFCISVLSKSFNSTYNDYAIIPFNLRFVLSAGLTQSKITDRLTEMEKAQPYADAWELYLPELANNKEAFIVFFKYIFADYY